MLTIKIITFGTTLYDDARRLREEVLRLPLGLTLSPQDVQGEESQIHIAALDADGKIAGAVILKPLAAGIVKLRQMAVAPDWRGKGAGRDLVRFAETLAAARDFRTIDMHARVGAQVFYEKLGYRATGPIFTEVTVPTVRMTKSIGAASD